MFKSIIVLSAPAPIMVIDLFSIVKPLLPVPINFPSDKCMLLTLESIALLIVAKGLLTSPTLLSFPVGLT
ncbi:hypothetical protein [Methanobrevibacter smithii]|uniref:hypothetical protein n=1 Tax=Methanobrevibacter smithii TaxID=2173 RepID=UPI0037DC9232